MVSLTSDMLIIMCLGVGLFVFFFWGLSVLLVLGYLFPLPGGERSSPKLKAREQRPDSAKRPREVVKLTFSGWKVFRRFRGHWDGRREASAVRKEDKGKAVWETVTISSTMNF